MDAACKCGLVGHIRRGRYNGRACPNSCSTETEGVTARPRSGFAAGALAARDQESGLPGSCGSCPCSYSCSYRAAWAKQLPVGSPIETAAMSGIHPFYSLLRPRGGHSKGSADFCKTALHGIDVGSSMRCVVLCLRMTFHRRGRWLERTKAHAWSLLIGTQQPCNTPTMLHCATPAQRGLPAKGSRADGGLETAGSTGLAQRGLPLWGSRADGGLAVLQRRRH